MSYLQSLLSLPMFPLLCGINLITLTSYTLSHFHSWPWLSAQSLSSLAKLSAPSSIICGLTFDLISCHSSTPIYPKFQHTPNHSPIKKYKPGWYLLTSPDHQSLLPLTVLCSQLYDHPLIFKIVKYIFSRFTTCISHDPSANKCTLIQRLCENQTCQFTNVDTIMWSLSLKNVWNFFSICYLIFLIS